VAAGFPAENLADGVKLQVVQTGIFSSALRVVEYYKPEAQSGAAALSTAEHDDALTHVLSKAAHEAALNIRRKHALAPLLSGPLALLTFPTVSPQHLKTAISILSPSAPQFPAPTRRANPGWHDPPVQAGIQKLLLLGARVEGKVFDVERTKWVGSIEGGLEGLRGQLVATLQGVGAGITNTLESAAKTLYFTVESRRSMLEDEGKEEAPKEEGKAE
jgi:ribosomal protein L10